MDLVGAWHRHGRQTSEWTPLGHGTVMAADVDMATCNERGSYRSTDCWKVDMMYFTDHNHAITHLSDCYKSFTVLIIKALSLKNEPCGWFNLLLFPSLFCHCPAVIHPCSGILSQSIPSEQIHRLTSTADHLEPNVSNGVAESPREPTAT